MLWCIKMRLDRDLGWQDGETPLEDDEMTEMYRCMTCTYTIIYCIL